MKYTEPREVEYDTYEDPEGERIFGYVTKEVPHDDTFGDAVKALVLKETKAVYLTCPVLMTTARHWSGYSEFTITNEWSQITLTIPEWNWERHWPSLGDFLRALADANPEADR